MKSDKNHAETSFALDIMRTLKQDNNKLFIANILLATALVISLLINFLGGR